MSAKKGPAVIRDHGVAAGAHLGCDTKAQLPRRTWPARSRARSAREYASKTDHKKTKSRARREVGGGLPSPTDRPIDRPPFRSLISADTDPRRVDTPNPTPRPPISKPPMPLPPPRHRHHRAREHVFSGRVWSIDLRVLSFRRRGHVIIIFELSSRSHPLSHHCRNHRRSGSGSGVSGTCGRVDKHAHFPRSERDILISISMRWRVGTDHDTTMILSSAQLQALTLIGDSGRLWHFKRQSCEALDRASGPCSRRDRRRRSPTCTEAKVMKVTFFYGIIDNNVQPCNSVPVAEPEKIPPTPTTANRHDDDIATRERQVNGGAARRGKGGGALRRLDVPGEVLYARAVLPFFANSYP